MPETETAEEIFKKPEVGRDGASQLASRNLTKAGAKRLQLCSAGERLLQR